MHRYWNDGWSGNWWWMAIMMIAFWGGIIWIAVTFIHHKHAPHPLTPGPAPAMPTNQSPQAALAERLARGEIEPDDYRQRLDTLEHRPNAKP